MDRQVIDIDVAIGANQSVQESVAANGDHELVALAVIIAVVGVVAVYGVFFAIWFFIRLAGAMRPQLQDELLEGPALPGIVRRRGYNSFVSVLGAPVKVTLQMLSMAGDAGKIVRLHALGAGVADLVAIGVTVACRLQAIGGAGLLQRPRTAGDRCVSGRSIARPAHRAVVTTSGERPR